MAAADNNLNLAPSIAAGVSTRVPRMASWRLVLTVLVIGLVLAAGWEGWLAAQGVQPDRLPNETDHWLETFDRVGRESPQVVFVGSSRTQQDISPEEVARVLGIAPGRVINLGISAGSGLPVAELLADQPDFKGVIVIEVFPSGEFGTRESPLLNACIDRLTQPAPYRRAETAFHRLVQTQLRLCREEGDFLRVVQADLQRIRGLVPAPTQLPQNLHNDRWREMLLLAERGEPRTRSAAEFTAQELASLENPDRPWEVGYLVNRYDHIVRRFEHNGAQVLVARFPSGMAVNAYEEARFPRSTNWDLLAERLGDRCWHFADDPEASSLQTFDGSHLAGPEARRLSRRIGEILNERYFKHARE